MVEVDDWLTHQSREVKRKLATTDRFTFAKFLYSRDISNFDQREIVVTEGLSEQKLRSATPFEKFVVGIVDRGFTFQIEEKELDSFGGRMVKVNKELEEINKNELYNIFIKETQVVSHNFYSVLQRMG